MRLYRDLDLDWRDRRHFFAVTAGMMRRILVDHARRRGRAKRGGGALVRLDDPDAIGVAPAFDLLALDDALSALAEVDGRKAQIVDLHFFGGLSVAETANVLDCSESTVCRDWRMAKAWLLRHLEA